MSARPCSCTLHVWTVLVPGRPPVMVEGKTAADAADAYARLRGYRDLASSPMHVDNIIGDDVDDKTSALGARGGRDSASRAKPDL